MNAEQLKLFDDYSQLLLPKDLMEYTPYFLDSREAATYLEQWIREIPWQQHKVKMYDKLLAAPRLCAWFGDAPIKDGDTRTVLEWTPELYDLKQRLEQSTGVVSTVCCLITTETATILWHGTAIKIHLRA